MQVASVAVAGRGVGNVNEETADKEDFNPVVLNDSARWLSTWCQRLYRAAPSFECRKNKGMVMMDKCVRV
jgi:hypothetical protein